MPIRYSSPLPKLPKEFIIPSPEPSFIWWLFRNLCIECKHPAHHIHEIIPRSRSKNSILEWENRVTLCQNCHNEYHKKGVNDKAIKAMQDKRIEFLQTMGRSEYVGYVPKPEIVVEDVIILELAVG